MKIAHLNVTYGVGSTGRLIKDLVDQARQQGHECQVFYSERGIEAPEARPYLSVSSRKIHAVASRVSGLQGYWSRSATRKLLAVLDDFSPDIVHLHVLHGNCICLPLLFEYLLASKLPVVITLHDCWWLTGKCVHPSAYHCDKFLADCKNCPAQKDCNPSWFFDRAEKMLADKRSWLLAIDKLAVVAVSDWMAEQARQSFVPQKCISRIYNWVDSEIFQPVDGSFLKTQMGLENSKVVLGVAALWGKEKGLEDMLTLADTLPQEYRVVLVGKIPSNKKLPENILHIPHTDSRKQLAQLYSMADVYVNPSRMEAFGLTTVEAISCGTPAIVYDLTACPELIGPDTGKVLPAGADIEVLQKAVVDLCAEKKNASACRNWITQNFNDKKNGNQYLDLYRQMTNL